MFRRVFCWSLAMLALAIPALAAAPSPSPVRAEVLILPEGWSASLPPVGLVEAPEFLDALAPGQRFVLALASDDPDRQQLLARCRLSVRITMQGSTVALDSLRPAAVRAVMAEGAGEISDLLESADIDLRGAQGDSMKLAMSTVSLATFEIDWAAPTLAAAADVQIDATITGCSPDPGPLHATLRVRPWSDWGKDADPDFMSAGAEIASFYKHPNPGRLLPLFRAATNSSLLEQPNVLGFFIAAFRRYPAAKQVAIDALPELEELQRGMLIWVLRMGGDDIAPLDRYVPKALRAELPSAVSIGDPRQFRAIVAPVQPDSLADRSNQADFCWGGWMATGDPSYLRALVPHLAGASDYPALKKWMDTHGGVKGLTLPVARGFVYKVVGKSLFVHRAQESRVRQWLDFWRTDPSLPAVIRDELVRLPHNQDLAR